jgi:periplasmic divalent cation tolerance protein
MSGAGKSGSKLSKLPHSKGSRSVGPFEPVRGSPATMNPAEVMIGWTTVGRQEDARRIATALVEMRLAACAQISAAITSVYRWGGVVEEANEFRLTLKFVAKREPEVRAFLEANHPYEVPQWICCAATSGSEKYLNWVVENST